MQERINKRRFALLVALTITTLFFFWWIQPENRLDVDENIFRVEDLGSISSIALTSDTDSVRLAFDGGRWRVNDQYAADADMIRVLFATLQQATPRRRVPRNAQDSIFQAMKNTAVKVSLFQGTELKKEFYAAGNATKTQAWFADPETASVFVMTIPGYRVYVSGILELKENGWRDKFVFGFNWRNFKSLEVQFPQNPRENFEIAMSKGYFDIQGMEADTSKLNTFLDDVSLLTVEEYLSEPKLADSLALVQPQIDLRVSDIGNRIYRLRIFSPGKSREDFGLIGESQAAVFDRRKIVTLLKPKSFFRKK